MEWTPALETFIAAHLGDDTARLLLSAHRYPDVDVPAAVGQIEARRQIRTKLPEWYAHPRLMMGGRIAAEQCSSEQTARYKQTLVRGRSLCDLTGGMGVDFYYMSRGLERAVYVERQPQLCVAARHNLGVLGVTQATVCAGDALSYLASHAVGGALLADTIYLDPARRAADGSRVYDLHDCDPDVVLHREALLGCCRRLIVKVSPMADLSRLLEQMPGVAEFHIVAVRNECKEVLLVFDVPALDARADGACCPDSGRPAFGVAPVASAGRDGDGEEPRPGGPKVCCIDFLTSREVRFDYTWADESLAQPTLAASVEDYLYEPDVTLLKAGAFRVVGQRFGVKKLEANSHLYTSDRLLPDFPGRAFAVDEVMPFGARLLKTLRRSVPQANISARNFPLSADALRARAGIRDGGDVYLFATRLGDGRAVLMRCRKALAVLLLCLLSVLPLWADRRVSTPSFVEQLSGIGASPLSRWEQGKEFVCTDSAALALVMRPEEGTSLVPEAADSSASPFAVGTQWRFHSVVLEENWLGQQEVSLRFLAPTGQAFRFATGQTDSVFGRDDYFPQVAGLGDGAVFRSADSLLRARTLYILVDDERILPADSFSAALPSLKFCPVTVDSVSYGTDVAPLRVWFRRDAGDAVFRGSVLTALPESREAATSTPLHKLFSPDDPYLRHLDITAEVWSLICRRRIRIDMTAEEVRLSLGRPYRSEQRVTRQGIVQLWFYRSGQVLELLDGRLWRIATQP